MAFEIISYRLHNQHLSQTDFKSPAEVVNWFGAVQSQDYLAAKWALGLRAHNLTDADMENAFTDGSILRTHILRPTWHFVTPQDIRWMLALTAPRVLAQLKYMDRQVELDGTIIPRTNKILEKTLQGGKHLTRAELGSVLEQQGIQSNDLRLTHIVMHAELDGVICSGRRQGKQFTYALLEERVPPAKPLDNEEALAELTRGYFSSHGPATLKDFIWWSGLSAADAKRGLEMIQSDLSQKTVDGIPYWSSPALPDRAATGALFLPCYDEYTVGYTDRSAIFDNSHNNKLDARGSFIAQYTILWKGRIVGTWKRTLKTKSVELEAHLFAPLKKSQTKAVIEAAERYASFLNLPFTLSFAETV